jgi:predicted nucleic acid-binding protein
LINVGRHPLTLGLAFADAPSWASPVIDFGRRDAAFVDTGFIVALLRPADGLHELAKAHWENNSSLAYTTPLVAAEVVRQLAKSSSVTQPWRVERVSEVRRMIVDRNEIIVCETTRGLVHAALRELDEMQRTIDRLDLCDCLSMIVLDSLRHRRVFGFDSDFQIVGATLEP